jgi:DNA-3-methyladenine glycosylase
MGVSGSPDRPLNSRLPREFFERDPVTCARELIGCRLVWGRCAGIIVETEAYAAVDDEASHTWSRPSARAFVASHAPGAAYVYFNYGMYWMLNVLIKGGSIDGFVLFRALEPTDGLRDMTRRRAANLRKSPKSRAPMPATALCSGPGKLAQALGVTGQDHGTDFCSGDRVGLYAPAEPIPAIAGVRIGISLAQHLPWRFGISGHRHLSVPFRD